MLNLAGISEHALNHTVLCGVLTPVAADEEINAGIPGPIVMLAYYSGFVLIIPAQLRPLLWIQMVHQCRTARRRAAVKTRARMPRVIIRSNKQIRVRGLNLMSNKQ